MELARLLTSDGRELATVELATSSLARARGLLGRPGLPSAHALWLAPCRAIHTIGMRFAIDIVFLDRRSAVVAVCASVPPWRLVWGGWHARGALEFAAGECARLGVRRGDTLQMSAAGGGDGAGSAENAAL